MATFSYKPSTIAPARPAERLDERVEACRTLLFVGGFLTDAENAALKHRQKMFASATPVQRSYYQWVAKQRAEGRCVRCRRPLDPDSVANCTRHKQLAAARQRKLRASRSQEP